jgi:hypothetical protein
VSSLQRQVKMTDRRSGHLPMQYSGPGWGCTRLRGRRPLCVCVQVEVAELVTAQPLLWSPVASRRSPERMHPGLVQGRTPAFAVLSTCQSKHMNSHTIPSTVFTPCGPVHRYASRSGELSAAGVDLVACLSVNDP